MAILALHPMALRAQPANDEVNAEAIAKIAQAITVRIEGVSQGSGILVKRDRDHYVVLTAWHVVSGQRPGEELDIYTSDGQHYPLAEASIRQIRDLDLATISFISKSFYQLAIPAARADIPTGSTVYVSGFPLSTAAIPRRIWRFLSGTIVATSPDSLPGGYQILHSAQTLPGMSGGPVLNARGQLIGIHGQGEIDIRLSEQEGIAVKTGTNQAIPISAWLGSGLQGTRSHLVTPVTESGQNISTRSIGTDSLSSSRNMAGTATSLYREISKALGNGDYRQAEALTQSAAATDAGESAPLTIQGVSRLSCGVLADLDRAWRDGSNEKQGLSIQSEILKNGFQAFEVVAGWRKGGFLTYTDPSRKDYPDGYFPRQIANGPIIVKLIERFNGCPGLKIKSSAG
jgi:hypothetical protein